MKSRLDRITNWDERLADARWQGQALARGCGIGAWELRHYIHLTFGLRLHEWITRRRMARALVLFGTGVAVKEISWALGYKQASHFSREFKRFYGVPPTHSSFPAAPPDWNV